MTDNTYLMVKYLRQELKTVPGLIILNEESPFCGHLAIRSEREDLPTSEVHKELVTKHGFMCDYNGRFNLIRMSIHGLYVTMEDC